jgi:hypothetical protein
VSDDTPAGQTLKDSPPTRIRGQVRLVIGMATGLALGLVIGLAVAPDVLISKAARRPPVDNETRLFESFPPAPETVVLRSDKSCAGISDKSGRTVESSSQLFHIEIQLADRHEPFPPAKDALKRDARLNDICTFYRDYMRSLGFGQPGNCGAGGTNGLLAFGERDVLSVTAAYTPSSNRDGGENDHLIVHILYFSAGYPM